MSQFQNQSHTIRVPQNAVQIAYWPPHGTTRVLATSGLNGCTALGIISPQAGILAHIAPIPGGQSATTGNDDPGKRNLIRLVRAVIDLYNRNRTYFPVAQSFVVVAMYGGSTALPEHRQTIQAVLQRLGLSCTVKEYNVLDAGTPRSPGETSVAIVSDEGADAPPVSALREDVSGVREARRTGQRLVASARTPPEWNLLQLSWTVRADSHIIRPADPASHSQQPHLMDSVLDLFDFSGKVGLQPNLPTVLDGSLDSAVARVEEAAAVGNTPLLAEALSDLQALPGSGPYLERPGGTLCIAARHGHREALDYLLARNVSVTPDAVTTAVIAKDEWILDLLLRSGWKIDEPLGLTTPSALALAVEDSALVSWFLERGASPNAQCSLDLTPLSVAVQFSSMPIIRSLFDHGGSVLHAQLLHYAVRRDLPDQADVLDFILSKQPQINHVMYQEHPQSYFSQRMFGLGTPLHEAAEQGKLDVVRKLLESGTHPLIRDSCGRIPLQRAERTGRDLVVAYLGPITASAELPGRQFTEDKETTGWS
ncbi:hypothetical protein LTR33_001125 [Friedmanniomyces endolithicus]|nr:hypothetical protein LTR33_001125 [Friedmanniomyces endolithicus]